jgi:hypothetical protein
VKTLLDLFKLGRTAPPDKGFIDYGDKRVGYFHRILRRLAGGGEDDAPPVPVELEYGDNLLKFFAGSDRCPAEFANDNITHTFSVKKMITGAVLSIST